MVPPKQFDFTRSHSRFEDSLDDTVQFVGFARRFAHFSHDDLGIDAFFNPRWKGSGGRGGGAETDRDEAVLSLEEGQKGKEGRRGNVPLWNDSASDRSDLGSKCERVRRRRERARLTCSDESL